MSAINRSVALLVISTVAASADVDFRQQVAPVLENVCIRCHSAEKAKGGLRLDDIGALRKGGKHGALFVAGDADKSLLIKQVTGDPPDMPENEPPLSAVKVKIPRSKVYQIMALTTFTGACGYVGTAYWGRLRKQIA